MHWCANVVCGPRGSASAVLLRAGEVVEGADIARSRRPSARVDAELARGPARLTTALGVGGDQNGLDLVTDPGLWLEPAAQPASVRVRTGPRVGIRGDGGDGGRFPWRFWLDDDRTVSTYRPGQPRRRARPEGDIVRRVGTAPAAIGEDRT
jgi:DNA-3-methyladenine glycosylase